MASGALGVRRTVGGYTLALAAPLLLIATLVPLRDRLDLASDVLLFMLVVVLAALVGGRGPALVAAALGTVLLNYFFTEPFHTFDIHQPEDGLAIVVFTLVAVLVGWVVDVAARRAEAEAEAAHFAAADRIRTALLAAVGHDLRTPLATAKAATSGLLSPDVELEEQDRRELLDTADGALDRLTALVENLLDMSRLQAGALPVHRRPVAVEDVLAGALDDLGIAPRAVLLDVADDLPLVMADAGLLERAVVNLVANAQRYAPADEPPVVSAAVVGDRVEVRVADTGPGIPPEQWSQVFLPFQRLGDTDASTGVGLGLAVARGLVEAMGGEVTPTRSPGGGLTMVISLEAAR